MHCPIPLLEQPVRTVRVVRDFVRKLTRRSWLLLDFAGDVHV
ncbi:hypothetical protein SFR_1702 [Streptomyces sp. FR-008]|nr:hypothetical protein SFR_1702 [Streptomyces sp. FR-008]